MRYLWVLGRLLIRKKFYEQKLWNDFQVSGPSEIAHGFPPSVIRIFGGNFK